MRSNWLAVRLASFSFASLRTIKCALRVSIHRVGDDAFADDVVAKIEIELRTSPASFLHMRFRE